MTIAVKFDLSSRAKARDPGFCRCYGRCRRQQTRSLTAQRTLVRDDTPYLGPSISPLPLHLSSAGTSISPSLSFTGNLVRQKSRNHLSRKSTSTKEDVWVSQFPRKFIRELLSSSKSLVKC